MLDGRIFYLHHRFGVEPYIFGFQGSLLGQSTGCLKRLLTLTSEGILPEVYELNVKVLICVSLRPTKGRGFKPTIF